MTIDNEMMPTEKDYALLGLDPAVAQNPVVVKAVYRALAREVHPDVGGSDATFTELRSAYERVLALAESPPEAPAPRAPSWTTGSRPKVDEPLETYEPYESSSPDPPKGGVATTLCRFLFLSRLWPASELGVFVGLVISVFLGILIHYGVHQETVQAFAEIAPTALFVCRVLTLQTRRQPTRP